MRAGGGENVQDRGRPESVGVAELVLDGAPRDVRFFGDQFDADGLGPTVASRRSATSRTCLRDASPRRLGVRPALSLPSGAVIDSS